MRASHRSKMRSFRRCKGELFRNHELYSSAVRTPATPGNALASAVTAARIHTTTPANSGVISYTAGQRRVLDEQAAHVLAGARRGEGVEHGVGDGRRAGQAGEELRDVGLSDPGQPAVGSFH